MSKRVKKPAVTGAQSQLAAAPKSRVIAERGIRTSQDFRDMMAAMLGDVLTGRLAVGQTNAACNVAGKLLKTIELEFKYARHAKDRKRIEIAQ